MRVLCIDAKNISPCSRCGSIEAKIKEGNEFNAFEPPPEDKDPDSYDIQEDLTCFFCLLPRSYDKRRFIRISDIDETTFERNYKTEIV